MERAVIYARVSSEDQAREGTSLETQIQRLLGYCQATELDCVADYVEEAVSGGKPLAERPQARMMLDLVKRSGIKHIVTLRLDRMFRSLIESLNMAEAWREEGIAFHMVDHGGQSINTGSSMGWFFYVQLSAFAQFERMQIVERTSAAVKHKRITGKKYCNRVYGWCPQGGYLVEDEAEQRVIARMLNLRKSGLSLRAIAADLNAAKISTAHPGGRWQAETVRRITINPTHGIGSALPAEGATA